MVEQGLVHPALNVWEYEATNATQTVSSSWRRALKDPGLAAELGACDGGGGGGGGAGAPSEGDVTSAQNEPCSPVNPL